MISLTNHNGRSNPAIYRDFNGGAMVLPQAIEWTGSMSVRDAVFTSGIFPKITFNSIAKGPEWPAKVTKECKARANR
jgi:hypothetical protein